MGLFAVLSVFIFTQATAEVGNVQSVSQVVSNHIDRDALYLSSNSTITDEDGRVIAEISTGTNRIYLPYKDMPTLAIDAFVATEDRRFFDHHGFDATGIARAFFANLDEGSIDQGASTITQQMVRNIFLDHSRTYERKISELLYAYELEQQYTKEEILELYLNSIFFGNNAYGIEAASRLYFSDSASNLSLAQIAFLTAIPNNPTFYDPLTNEENTHNRKEWVLQKMEEEGFISAKEHANALNESLEVNSTRLTNSYPDYSDYITSEFSNLVREQDGLHDATSTEIEERITDLFNQGITIETALDSKRQERLVDSFYRELPLDVHGAGIVLDNKNQTIVAISNGREYTKGNWQHATESYRSHGSAFKPLIDYAPFIEETGSPISMVVNGNPNPSCTEEDQGEVLGCVPNYNDVLPGSVSLREAFKHSYNVPAQYLLDQVGVEKAISYLEPFPFSKMHDEERGLALALGSIDVTVYEMAQAYSAFAQDGTYRPSRGITGVYNEHGDLIYQWPKAEEKQIWSKETNEKMRELLSEVIQTGTGRSISLDQDGFIGGKTGTTNNYRDLAFSGLTDRYTASVWVGRDSGYVEDLSPQRPAMNIWETAVRD